MKNNKPQQNVVSFLPTGDFYYTKAMDAMLLGQIEKTHKYLLRAVELEPTDARSFLQLGILALDAENYHEAYDYIAKAHMLDPTNTETLFFMSESAGCLGLVQEAKSYASKYLTIAPEGPYAEEAKEIITFFDYEAEAMPGTTEHTLEEIQAQEKARLLMEQGDFEQAVGVLEDVIIDFPKLWSAYNNLALAYFYIGEATEAKATLASVLRGDPGNLHALCNLAVIAFYEKDEETLHDYITLLNKIQPYAWEDRYKLGATLALMGEYEGAYKWLNSMQKRGYEGDPGFYFWLAHAAYYTGAKQQGERAWDSLVAIDPTKKDSAPWLTHAKDRDFLNELAFIRDKLASHYSSDHLFALFLISKSAYRDELLSEPAIIDVENYTGLEKMYLAFLLGHTFSQKEPLEKIFLRASEVAELLYEQVGIKITTLPLYQLWFVLYENAINAGYTFKNPKALAAANEYLFLSAHDERVTKKAIAEKYAISPSTLTKYIDELLNYLPDVD